MDIPFGYERLGYVALNVTDVERTTVFYRDIVGLEPYYVAENGVTLLRCDKHVASVALYPAREPGLRRVAFQLASSEHLENARKHFSGKGYDVWDVAPQDRDLFKLNSAFRVYEPLTGVTFELFDKMGEASSDFEPTVARILRLGHVVMRTDRLSECWRALSEDFGLLSSDIVENKAIWARAYPNPLHHTLALVDSDERGFHHVNFMVSDIDDIGKAVNRLSNANIDIVFGPGRHKPSNSIFLYFLDPDGMTNEYSFGMEEFPPEGAREARKLENTLETMDLWGGEPDPKFSIGGSIGDPDR